MPDGADQPDHLRLAPHAAAHRLGDEFNGVIHWTTSIAPAARWSLEESVEDALAHLARCLSPEDAEVVWESAVRVERISLDALRGTRWPNKACSVLADSVQGLSDSGLETIFAARLRHWNISLQQQFLLAGHYVDILIGERLVVQIDGFAHHSTAAQRGRDLAHDAELRLRGYTVLRFSYAQVVHDWRYVERTIARAVGAGLHL